MPDHFEKAKDEILGRTEGNGGPSNADLLKALQGLAQDGDEQAERLEKKVEEGARAFRTHCLESKTAIDDLTVWRNGVTTARAADIRAALDEHVELLHPESERFKLQQLWSLRTAVISALLAVLLLIMNLFGDAIYHWVTGSP